MYALVHRMNNKDALKLARAEVDLFVSVSNEWNKRSLEHLVGRRCTMSATAQSININASVIHLVQIFLGRLTQPWKDDSWFIPSAPTSLNPWLHFAVARISGSKRSFS